MESLLNLKTDETTTFVIQDILRMVTIQVFTQMLFVLNNNDVSFFNMKFIKTTIFILFEYTSLLVDNLSAWLQS